MANETDLIQKFIDSSHAVIYIKDEQGRFIMVNRYAAGLVNLSPEDFVGKTDHDFFSKEDSDMFRANDLKVTEAGTPMSFKGKHTTEGGERTIIDHKFPVSLEGHPNSVGGIAIDITDLEE
ncbi:MAG: PAS domain-containing protein [Thermodesulfobacteriota bacterium]